MLIDEIVVVQGMCRPGVVSRINENGADIYLLVGLPGWDLQEVRPNINLPNLARVVPKIEQGLAFRDLDPSHGITCNPAHFLDVGLNLRPVLGIGRQSQIGL
jgi:hypothetical protein